MEAACCDIQSRDIRRLVFGVRIIGKGRAQQHVPSGHHTRFTQQSDRCGRGDRRVQRLDIRAAYDDEEKARARLEQALCESFKAGDWPHVPQARNRHLDAEGRPLDKSVLAGFVAQMALVGTPERVADQLREIETATGATRFVLYMEAIAEKEIILESVERFAGEVMPLLSTNVAAAAG